MSRIEQLNPPDLTDVLKELKRDIGVAFNCVQVGIVQDFDAADQTATVLIALKKITAETPEGVRTYEERPLLLKCPCMMLYGGSTYMTFPIAAGDNCIILFNDREIDNWWANGGIQTPTSKRAHDIADAMVIVGVRSLQNSIANYLTNGIRIQYNDESNIEIKEDLIESIAELFLHNGSMEISGNLTIQGETYGNSTSGDWTLKANLKQDSSYTLQAGNGATGSFDQVTVVDGIVTGGS